MKPLTLALLLLFVTGLSACTSTSATRQNVQPLTEQEAAQLETLSARPVGTLTDDERLDLALLTARAAQERAHVADTKANTLMAFTVLGILGSVAVSIIALAPESE